MMYKTNFLVAALIIMTANAASIDGQNTRILKKSSKKNKDPPTRSCSKSDQVSQGSEDQTSYKKKQEQEDQKSYPCSYQSSKKRTAYGFTYQFSNQVTQIPILLWSFLDPKSAHLAQSTIDY